MPSAKLSSLWESSRVPKCRRGKEPGPFYARQTRKDQTAPSTNLMTNTDPSALRDPSLHRAAIFPGSYVSTETVELDSKPVLPDHRLCPTFKMQPILEAMPLPLFL